MTSIKICGLTRLEDIEAVNRVRPDYVGFVFWSKSRRAIDMETALMLRRTLDPAIPAVGVFVDQPMEDILALLRARAIDIAQLHGHETPEDIKALKGRGCKSVWKAFKVRTEEDLTLAEESPADLVLLDNGYGTGERFDWSLLIRPPQRPWLLAGGLTPENIPEAIRTFAPWGIDISSGVETNGQKDPDKIMAAVAAARRGHL